MSDQPKPVRSKRSSYVNVRVQPALRARIEDDARANNMTASAVVRKVLAKHYSTNK